jgi:hypothetical protein
MTLHEKLIEEYPELVDNGKIGPFGPIILQNDGDGDYIRQWDYEKPLTEELSAYLK